MERPKETGVHAMNKNYDHIIAMIYVVLSIPAAYMLAVILDYLLGW